MSSGSIVYRLDLARKFIFGVYFDLPEVSKNVEKPAKQVALP